MGKLQQAGESLDLRARVEILLRPAEPERAAGLGREMPLNDFAQVGIEFLLRGFDGSWVNRHGQMRVVQTWSHVISSRGVCSGSNPLWAGRRSGRAARLRK